eukprot:CAMPEP_0174718994 /NCGR_PEP_ID=MMETSP1094-20130205/30537_1 /TAXON_ID=156173 /ORGANISM="Chrysochromulina brevifilum, Strain UTEX LB 985" /LENGTH=207 /DNA_ID=CAMNT_0015919229 /DNA_START=54 /DNA_END=677 /DNA_ORIENTATION=+
MSTHTLAQLQGVYNFQYAGGEFEVSLRSGGRFFCQNYQQPADWSWDPPTGKISINWKKYGAYELIQDKEITEGADARCFTGSLKDKPESWRKMSFKRDFTKAEMQLFDSEWEFIHKDGSFPVKFKADGYNHFICDQFPSHSHWKLENGASATPTLFINWGKYGEYELVIDADGENMTGGAKGNQDNWRKAKRKGKMDDTGDVHVHDH